MRGLPVAVLALFLVLAPPARGEEAIVLSGGGSRGLAHPGALVGLERQGHDPGIVVGTSMGAIVGALYAAGYTPDQIWKFVLDEDWRRIFEPMPIPVGPERELRHPILTLQSGHGGALITRGYIADWRINRELVRRLFPASARARGDFDRLPRRFRSIAADLDSGHVVSLGSGDLARAARASMAAAGFFSPVHWGDRTLFDGGIGDYLPVAEARAIGADDVIAVDALRPTAKAESEDALSVARRSVDLLVVKVRSGQPDVLVLPKIDPSLSPYTFPVDPTQLLEQGLEAAIATIPPTGPAPSGAAPTDSVRPNSTPVAVPPDSTRPDSASAAAPPDSTQSAGSQDSTAVESSGGAAFSPRTPESPPERLSALIVDPPGSALAPVLTSAFRQAAGNYDSSAIFRSVDRLYATGIFDGVWPSVEMRGDSATLVIRAESQGSISLRGAPGYDNDRGGRIWAAFQKLSFVSGTPLTLGLEGSVDGIEQWGTASLRIASLSRWISAWTLGGSYGEFELPFLEAGSNDGNTEVHRGGGWLGVDWLRFDPDLTASAGLNAEHISADVGPEGSSIGPWVRIGFLPRLAEEIGTTPEISAKLRFGEADYWKARAKISLARSFGRLSAALIGDLTGVAEGTPLDDVPSLGEEHLVPALRWGEHRGRVRGVVGADGSTPGPLGGTLRLRLRGGALVNELRLDTAEYGTGTEWIGGAGLSVIWWSFLGKIEAGLEAGTLGDRRIAIELGPRF